MLGFLHIRKSQSLPEQPPRAQLRALIESVRATPYYRKHEIALTWVDLASPPAQRASLEEWLAGFPLVDARAFLDAPEMFCNPTAPRMSARAFRYPWDQLPRTAVLCPASQDPTPGASSGLTRAAGWLRVRPGSQFAAFKESFQVRLVHQGEWSRLAKLRPDVLAGPLPLLRGLAAQVLAGVLEPPPLKLAVVAFTGPRDGLLSEADRDELWKAFQVPVRAKLHGFHRELLAWECEAQEGLHLEPGSAIVETIAGSQELAITCLDNFECPCLRVRIGLAAELSSMPCPCGRPGDRLLNLRAPVEALAARAACAAD